jgi:hypothetical protein
VTVKIFTKVFLNIFSLVIDGIIGPTQTAFLKGRYIMEGVCILYEVLNDIHKKIKPEMLFKIDFEKALHKIKWSFLVQVMEMKGIPRLIIDRW